MKSLNLTKDLYQYIVKHCPLPHPCLADLAEETATLPMAQMQISPDQGAFMHTLAKMIKAERVAEIGCFTGYSAICLATALPDHGQLISIDNDPETTKVAQRYFLKAGVHQRISLEIGDALKILPNLVKKYGPESFDLIFIDADKENLSNYYEFSLNLLRPGGVILVDNVLWSGRVIQPDDPTTEIINRFNEQVHLDNRTTSVLLNIADGLFFCVKN